MNNLKSKLKVKPFLLMLFVVLLGLALRLISINKPDGLWNDEYISWYIASMPLAKGFVQGIFSQCHMPFYYLYLKFFIHFFDSDDTVLRLTSVIPGVLSIIVMYFVGKEFKDSKLGILSASVTSLSSFLIYFSQEVRLYEVLFLFSSLSLLFTLRLGKQQNKFNFIFYILSNFLIIFTHTIGFVFVFFNLLFMSLWLVKIDKNYKKNILIIWSAIFLLGLSCIPLLVKIFTTHSFSQWWGHFVISRLAFMITDYFSPVLTNIVSAPDNFFYNFTLKFIIFALLPSAIAVAGMAKAIKTKEYEVLGLSYVVLAYLSVLVLMAILGKLVFVTKYSIEIYPILILIMGYGLFQFKDKWRNVLIFLFCFLNLFYVLGAKNSAPRIRRAEGHKIVAKLLKNADLKDGDIILLSYYPKERFEKYFDFSKYRVVSVDKGNFAQYLGADTKDDFRYLSYKYFDEKLNQEVISKLEKGQKVVFVNLNSVSMYSPVQMDLILKDDREYNKIPFLFMVFSQVKNSIMYDFLHSLNILRAEQKGNWAVITFYKR